MTETNAIIMIMKNIIMVINKYMILVIIALIIELNHLPAL